MTPRQVSSGAVMVRLGQPTMTSSPSPALSNGTSLDKSFHLFFTSSRPQAGLQFRSRIRRILTPPVVSLQRTAYWALLASGQRRKLTNSVFVLAFTSACLCVGGQSFFPDAGFHSNSAAGMKKRRCSLSQAEENNNQRSCPITFFQPSELAEQRRPQRKWLEEETPS
ncbi:hypothetical protein O181_021462 [Austropuccinia psidii MF-1]|uniref:Uncharacterized protein n=1 Tax=Austropuccinia psidii MF-1 TaxID=1389203 RepID=A0A9Q3CDP5_9BASI|nr:hypothetical protein [Austropuccinia psidii MF-1]